ncbi:MAG TPA: DUF6134 family protein [Stellaceae bacterium]|jgi:hypothetical protein|nr:DUF6134 family protein [Stellaceae bacterium]
MRRPQFTLSLTLCAVGLCGAILVHASAAQAATQVLTYNVEHPKYGNIGTYTNTVSQSGTSTDVRTDLHIAVKMIGIPLFHQDATRDEQWQNQRLVGFRSQTDDNGTSIAVTGKADGSSFVINSSAHGTLTAPEQVHPSNPWAPFVLQTDTMMSTKTGKLSPVIVKDTGEFIVTFDGRQMRVHQWFVDDDKHQVVWIDEKGVVVAFQTEEQGAAINFVLKTETTSAAPAAPYATR